MPRNLLLSLFLCLLSPALLLPVTIVVNPNPTIIATSVTSSVTGADMAGLIVTATYNFPDGPQPVTLIWNANGPDSGAAGTPPGTSLSVNGSASAVLAWHYSSTLLSPLISLELDGAAAGIYFDRAHSGPGTPGSGSGADISFSQLIPNGVESDIVATYSGAVSVDGNPPQNDLYSKLVVNFPAAPFGGLEPQDFEFTQPVDRNVAPEPASSILALIALGLGFVVRSIRMRRAY